MKKRVLILGANSDIGLSAGQRYLDQGYAVLFAAHKPDALPEWAQPRLHVDLQDAAAACRILEDVECDILLYVAGKLASNEECHDPEVSAAVRKVNFETPSTLFPLFAEKMKRNSAGVLVGVSSVAGDRGKAPHMLYGASKAAFDHFLAGMRQGLNGSGVRVLTIRPGYVNTKMIAGFQTPGWLTASREEVARKIVRHSTKGKRNVVYVKAIWRPMMWILRHIPEAIFKRLKL
jgi:hypothetical protein